MLQIRVLGILLGAEEVEDLLCYQNVILDQPACHKNTLILGDKFR